MANKYFNTRTVTHPNRINNVGPGIMSKVTVYDGNAALNNRAVKPVPLTDTDMTITRFWENGDYCVRGKYSGTVRFCWAGAPGTTVESDSQSSATASRLRALSKLGSGDVDLGESLPELRKTSAMITNRLARISDIAERITMGDIPGVEERIQNRLSRRQKRIMNGPKSLRMSSLFLELSYGWLPLVSDVYGSIDAYRTGIRTVGDTLKASTGTGRYRAKRGFIAGDDLPELASYATARGVVRNPAVRTLNELGLLNPALILWNALPYSFVVDWALPISGVLRALTADLGLSGVTTCSVTEKRQVTTFDNGPWYTTRQWVYRRVSSGSILGNFSLAKTSGPPIAVTANAVALMRVAIVR